MPGAAAPGEPGKYKYWYLWPMAIPTGEVLLSWSLLEKVAGGFS